jgi:hypothetical protein
VLDEKAKALGIEALALACGDSVDFELLFSATREDGPRAHKEFAVRGRDLFEIGSLAVPQSEPAVLLRTASGAIPFARGGKGHVMMSRLNSVGLDGPMVRGASSVTRCRI